LPTLSYDSNMKGWGPAARQAAARDHDGTTVDKFLTRMYGNNPDFVYTVTRDFVRSCQTPVLVLRTTLRRTRTPSPWNPVMLAPSPR
jgi:hypothetical protein